MAAVGLAPSSWEATAIGHHWRCQLNAAAAGLAPVWGRVLASRGAEGAGEVEEGAAGCDDVVLAVAPRVRTMRGGCGMRRSRGVLRGATRAARRSGVGTQLCWVSMPEMQLESDNSVGLF